MLLSSTLWLATVAFVFTSKARADGKVDPNVILSVQLDLATYGLINVPDTAIECIDNHAGWSGDCAQIFPDFHDNPNPPALDLQGNKIECHNLCCVVAKHKDGPNDLTLGDLAQWGSNANLFCNGPNEQTYIQAVEENFKTKGGSTFKMCLCDKNSAHTCK